MSDSTIHIPVLLNEILEWSAIAPNQIWIDGTAGGGGHAREIAARIQPEGRLLAIDRDPAAVERLKSTLANETVRVVQGSYLEACSNLDWARPGTIDGILLDLGLSSDQLADDERGFSFHSEGELDLRFDPTRGEPAWQFLESCREEDLANIIYEYGEERFSRRIARRIVERRREQKIRTAKELADLIHSSVPGRMHGRVDSATRTFQALRIAVNDELRIVESALKRLPELLKPGGRILVISFHSLEDRLVKNAFRSDEKLENLTKKPVVATTEELRRNPRSRSAKLRVAERRT